MTARNDLDLPSIAARLKTWARELGFQQAGIADLRLDQDIAHLERWLAEGMHGDMAWFAEQLPLRRDPQLLSPGALRAVLVRMDYLPPEARIAETLADRSRAYVSRYALGRDYHRTVRNRVAKLAVRLKEEATPHGYRVFTDSAPVLEKALAEKSGLGWIGKHSLLINREAGSWFFLGGFLTDLPLPVDEPPASHCGSCSACIDICPTQAIVAPYRVDARRCISYLTIEWTGSIPEELRAPIGNRVFGCDDCQLVCPWNRYAKVTQEGDFHARHGLDRVSLAECLGWDEPTFLLKTEGSALRRAGYELFLRNVAVGLGNAPRSPEVLAALRARENDPSPLVREHVAWALRRQAGND
ncbi:MAG: tRNA epoxyqueuosine(34) reductase QueG [Gammaproteobacteria bacterium]